MSDNQGDRPDESTAASTPESTPPAPAAPAESAPSAPAGATTPVASPASQQPVASPQPVDPQQPAAHQQPVAPQQPVAAQPVVAGGEPARTAYPAYPGTPPVPPYAGQHPQGYPGQPAQPTGGYAGHPAQPNPGYAYGQAFGVHPGQPGATPPLHTQPTLPLGGAASAGVAPTGAVATAPAKKSGAGRVVGLIVAAALVGGAAGLGGAYAGVNLWGTAPAASSSGPTTVTVNNTDSVNATTAIATKVLPSVVTIQAASGSTGGTGSGVVLSEDGYVVTNTHVVTLDGASANATIRVTTSDGKVYDAEIIATDPIYDLAVIKLKDASGLTPIEFGDSSQLNVGDQTVAVGAPLGLSNSVTTGIVSALNRSIEIASSAAPDSSDSQGDQGGQGGSGQDSPFFFDYGQGQQQQSTPSASIKIAVIQTDAAINPGNSGGALVDDEGRLIGINVAIATAGGTSGGQSGSIGVGFSIPSDIVKRVSDEIIATGQATHGLLGAGVKDAAAVDGSTITGAYISEVVAGGAAEAGGLRVGDTVTEFNGVPVTGATDLTAQVRAAAAGSKATVTYVRDGKTSTTDVTLGTLVP